MPPAAILGALITAGPDWMDRIDRWWNELPARIVQDPVNFDALWRKNYACTLTPPTWLTTAGNVMMASTVCPSGDVFVHAMASGSDYFGWLTLDAIMRSNSGAGGLISPAHAATVPPGMFRLAQAPGQPPPEKTEICHRFIDKQYLLRRLKTPQGCVDETIDMFKGMVVSTRPAPCTPNC